jgi:hypothetical protein
MNEGQPPGEIRPLSNFDCYQMVRARIEHEDNLITQRLNWFLASQSFLFSAYVINFNAPDSLRHDPRHLMLMAIIPIMAIGVALVVFMGVLAGLIAMRHLHLWLHRQVSREQLSNLPSLQWFPRTRGLGMAAPFGLPPLFIVVWVYIIICGKY